MKAPENTYLLFPGHANASFTASNTPGLKNSHCTAPNFITPQPNKILPLPGAAEHSPPNANETIGSLAADNHRMEFGWDGLGAEREVLWG